MLPAHTWHISFHDAGSASECASDAVCGGGAAGGGGRAHRLAYGETVVKMMSTMVYSGSNCFSQREAVTHEQDSNFCRKRLKEGHKKLEKRAKPCGKQFEKRWL